MVKFTRRDGGVDNPDSYSADEPLVVRIYKDDNTQIAGTAWGTLKEQAMRDDYQE